MLLITRLYIEFWKSRHRSSHFVESRPAHTQTITDSAAGVMSGDVFRMSTSGIRMERVPSEKSGDPLTASASGAANDAFGPTPPRHPWEWRWCRALAGWPLMLLSR